MLHVYMVWVRTLRPCSDAFDIDWIEEFLNFLAKQKSRMIFCSSVHDAPTCSTLIGLAHWCIFLAELKRRPTVYRNAHHAHHALTCPTLIGVESICSAKDEGDSISGAAIYAIVSSSHPSLLPASTSSTAQFDFIDSSRHLVSQSSNILPSSSL